MSDLLIRAKEQSILTLTNLLEKVRSVELTNKFTVLPLTSGDILDADRVNYIANGLPNKNKHVYFFEVDRPETLESYDLTSRSKDFKYAKINAVNKGEKCIYVGSCGTIKLKDRFVQHCGHKAPATYSLQLAQWIKREDELNFVFAYAYIDSSQDVLEEIEEGIRNLLKPVFGKAGPNNKS